MLVIGFVAKSHRDGWRWWCLTASSLSLICLGGTRYRENSLRQLAHISIVRNIHALPTRIENVGWNQCPVDTEKDRRRHANAALSPTTTILQIRRVNPSSVPRLPLDSRQVEHQNQAALVQQYRQEQSLVVDPPQRIKMFFAPRLTSAVWVRLPLQQRQPSIQDSKETLASWEKDLFPTRRIAYVQYLGNTHVSRSNHSENWRTHSVRLRRSTAQPCNHPGGNSFKIPRGTIVSRKHLRTFNLTWYRATPLEPTRCIIVV